MINGEACIFDKWNTYRELPLDGGYKRVTAFRYLQASINVLIDLREMLKKLEERQ